MKKKIHDIYPEIMLIGSAGPGVNLECYNQAWEFYQKQYTCNNKFVYAVDEHYYMEPEWFYQNTDFYDNYPRNIKVFSGEYAAHCMNGRNKPEANTLGAALAEAAFLTGVERNSDVVVLSSYAPLFARIGYTQWSPDMIWFDDNSCYASPSYYIQKMYSLWKGTVNLDTLEQQKRLKEENVYYNITLEEETNTIYLKIVNANDYGIFLSLKHENGKTVDIVQVYLLGGKAKDEVNSIDNLENITLKEYEINKFSDNLLLEKNTFAIIVLKLRGYAART